MHLKHDKDKERMFMINAILLNIMFDMNLWAHQRRLPFVITSTVSTKEEDDELGRKSDSHRTARAIDISVRGWSDADISQFLDHYNSSLEFEEYFYLSSSGVKRLAYFHNNSNGDHIHAAIHSRYAQRDLGKLP